MKSSYLIFFSILILLSTAFYGFKYKTQRQSGEYIILENHSPNELANEVAANLEYDYRCVGGVSAVVKDRTIIYIQAMQR